MSDFDNGAIKVKVKKDKIAFIAGFVLVAFIGAILVHLLLGSKAATPSSATIPVCGLRQNADVEASSTLPQPTSYKTSQIAGSTSKYVDKAVLSSLSPDSSNFVFLKGNAGRPDQIYIAQPGYYGTANLGIKVYDASSYALVNQFTLSDTATNINNKFALDSSGNVYIGWGNNGSWNLKKFNLPAASTTTSTNVSAAWTSNLSSTNGYNLGSVYGYSDNTNNFYIGASMSASGSWNIAYSEIFDVNGNVKGYTSVKGVQIHQAPNGDIISAYYSTNNDSTNSNEVDIYSNSPAPTIYSTSSQATATPTAAKFYMGSSGFSSSDPNQGPFRTLSPAGADELSNGNIVIADFQRGILIFSPGGNYLGVLRNDDAQADYTTDKVDPGTNLIAWNSNVYYLAGSPFSSNEQLVSTPEASINAMTNYPVGAPYRLGLGAGIVSNAPNNFFVAGSTNSAVNLQFNSWWQKQSSSLSGTYTVSNIDQIKSGTLGTSYSFTIPQTATSYSGGYANIPITLPTLNPGVYQVDTKLTQNGKTIGSDCLVYTVAASNVPNPNNISTGGQDYQNIQLAHLFGQKLFRSLYNLSDCYDTSQTPSTTLAIAATCKSGGAIYSDILQAQNYANANGMIYELQLGAGSPGDTSARSIFNFAAKTNGSLSNLTQQMMSNLPLSYYEAWNEPNSNGITPTDYVNSILIPIFNARNAASPTHSIKIIGISTDGHTTDLYDTYIAAGALSYMDIVGIHNYTSWNSSIEEDGNIVPSAYSIANPSAVSSDHKNIQNLIADLKSKGYTGQIFDTESGYWNLENYPEPDPFDFYNSADLFIRKKILEQSIGINYWNYFEITGPKLGDQAWSLEGGPREMLTPAGFAGLNYQAIMGNRSWTSWVPTNIPHSYAAEMSDSNTSNSRIVAIWSDDYNVSAVIKNSAGSSMSLTSEYGAASTINSGQTIQLSGQVQYITLPVGQTAQNITISPTESFGNNLLSSSSATTSVSSTACVSSPTTSPLLNSSTYNNGSNLLFGNTSSIGEHFICNGAINSAPISWSPAQNDTNPTMTINLKTAQNIDRVFTSSNGISSSKPGVRSYNVSVNPSCSGGSFTQVAQVNNLFFNRNNLVSFTAQTVCQIQISGITNNPTGDAGGLRPYWMTTGGWADTGGNAWAAPFYDIEAYASSASSSTTNLVPDAPTGLTASTKSSTEIDLSWTASTLPAGDSSSVTGYTVYRDGSPITSIGSVSTTSYKDTTGNPGTSYTYTVAAKDSASNVSAKSTAVSANTYTNPSIPSLSATSANPVVLNWSASDTGGPGLAAFYITRTNTSNSNSTTFTVTAPANSYTDNSVVAGTNYTYSIQSVDTVGDISVASAAVTASVPNPPDTTAPSVPSISVDNANSAYNQVSLKWTASVDNTGGSGLSGYTLYRNNVAIASLGSSAISYVDSSVSPSTTYSYSITASDNAGLTSAASPAVTYSTPAKPVIKPTAPSSLKATANTYNNVGLSWGASTDTGGPGLGGYYIIRNGVTITNVPSTSLSFSDTSVGASSSYTYTVVAYDISTPNAVVSDPSNSSAVSTPAAPDTTPPSAVSNLSSTPVSNTQINLSWNAATDNIGVSGYYIYRSGSSTPIASVTGTSYGDTKLSTSTSYTYTVVAFDAAGLKSSGLSSSAMTLALSGTASIYGIITNSSGSALQGVSVVSGKKASYSGQTQSTSNVSGQYLLINIVPNSSHYYYFTLSGYTNQTIYKSFPAGNNILNVIMK